MMRLKKAKVLKMTVNKALNKCIEGNNEKELSVCDVKTKLTFVNNKQDVLILVRIDGCLIPESDNSTKRCDFMVQHEDINYYVELKGMRHYKKACWQLTKSIEMFNKCFGNKTCQPIIVTLRKRAPNIPHLDIARSGLENHIKAGVCKMLEMHISDDFYPL